VLYCRAVDMAAETEQERSKRRHQRTLFDSVAQLYEASRPEYPSDIVEFAVATAAVGAGSEVLEVGCGTGQLTQSLACPLQRQGHPKIVSNRSAETIFMTHPNGPEPLPSRRA
jgi:2-polyprenyl-3-methyl-5-hydroxy-6-metoxy-1,4-benzoquinol methylase